MKRPVKGYIWTGKTDYDEGHKCKRHTPAKLRVMRKWKRYWQKLDLLFELAD